MSRGSDHMALGARHPTRPLGAETPQTPDQWEDQEEDRLTSRPGSSLARTVLALPGGATEDVALLRGVGLDVLTVESTGPALLAAVRHYRPDLVLAHTHLRGANRRLVATFAEICGAPTILLTPASLRSAAPQGNPAFSGWAEPYPPALLAEAERMGCAFVASWPPDPAELGMVATEAVTLARRAGSGALPGYAAHARALAAARVIVIRSDKGGVGKSGFSVNLACALSLRGGRRTLLIDLDIAGASLHTLLGLPADPRRGLEAAYAALQRWPHAGEPLDLTPYVATYPPPAPARETRAALDVPPDLSSDAPAHAPETSGRGPSLHLLAGIQDKGVGERFSTDEPALLALLTAARAAYDEVIIDVGTDITHRHHLLLAAKADRVLVVLDPMEDTLQRCAQSQAEVMNSTGLAPDRCRLVLNRVADTRRELDLATLTAQFGGIGVLGLLPEATYQWRRSISQHLPFVLSVERAERGSALVRAMEEIVNKLTPGLLPPPPPGLLDRLLGRTRRRRP